MPLVTATSPKGAVDKDLDVESNPAATLATEDADAR
jgi:hypothetical protein